VLDRRRWISAIVGAASLLSAVAASAVELPRVRPVDPCAISTLEQARLQSATVRELEDRLAAGNIVAYVACEWRAAGQPDGSLRWVSRTPQFRYVLVTVGRDMLLTRRIEMLGHELHHATEIAAEPWVADEASLRSLFTRIGRRTSWAENYETDGARGVERRVRHELVSGVPAEAASLKTWPR
jgi:hypothetical protein